MPPRKQEAAPAVQAPPPAPAAPTPAPEPPQPEPEPENLLRVCLNGIWLSLPPKADGTPYYLMDMLDYSGINFDSVDQPVELLVNGEVGAFTRPLVPNDDVVIRRQRQ